MAADAGPGVSTTVGASYGLRPSSRLAVCAVQLAMKSLFRRWSSVQGFRARDEPPIRIRRDDAVGCLAVTRCPGCEECSASVRDDPSVLAGTTGDEAGATGSSVGRRMAVELLDVHHAAYSVSKAIPVSRLACQTVRPGGLQMHRFSARSRYDL